MSYFFKSSGLAHLQIKENEQWLGFPVCNVLGEVPTHWGSFLRTGKKYLELERDIHLSLHSHNRPDLALNKKEWSLLKDLCMILQIFHDATVQASGTKYPTLNLVEPLRSKIKEVTDTSKEGMPMNMYLDPENKSTINKFCKAMHENLLTRYTEDSIKKTLTLAACVDPHNLLKISYWEDVIKIMF